MNERTHKSTDERINEQTNERINKNQWTYKWMDESIYKLMNQRTQKKWTEWQTGLNQWMNKWTWLIKLMNRPKHECMT